MLQVHLSWCIFHFTLSDADPPSAGETYDIGWFPKSPTCRSGLSCPTRSSHVRRLGPWVWFFVMYLSRVPLCRIVAIALWFCHNSEIRMSGTSVQWCNGQKHIQITECRAAVWLSFVSNVDGWTIYYNCTVCYCVLYPVAFYRTLFPRDGKDDWCFAAGWRSTNNCILNLRNICQIQDPCATDYLCLGCDGCFNNRVPNAQASV